MSYYGMMIALILLSYFLGNVNVSIIISKLKKSDVRKVGSGNPGTMNMLRSYGMRLGALTLILDAVKGVIPALLGWYMLGKGETFAFGDDKIGLFVCGLSVVVGHCFPVFYNFKGGKGVATSIGVSLVASPLVALVAFACAVIFFFTAKIGALASFIAICIPLIYEGVMAFMQGRIMVGLLSLAICLLVIVMHHANIGRIFRGEEKQVVMFGKNKSATKIQEEERNKKGQNKNR